MIVAFISLCLPLCLLSTVDKFCIDWVAGTSSSHPLLSILLVGERKSKAISSLKLNIILPRN